MDMLAAVAAAVVGTYVTVVMLAGSDNSDIVMTMFAWSWS
jgi:hypothetical protein